MVDSIRGMGATTSDTGIGGHQKEPSEWTEQDKIDFKKFVEEREDKKKENKLPPGVESALRCDMNPMDIGV